MAGLKISALGGEAVETSNLKRNVDTNLLDMFWDLSQIEQSPRLNAALSIILLLADKQKVLANDEKSPELEYAIERLVRGLASSRLAARQGFCVVLTEVLKFFPVVTVEDVVKYVERDLSFHNKLEKCHTVIGRLMAYTAIVRSRRLINDPYVSFIIINLYDLSICKSYIQQASYKLMVDLYSQLDAERFKELIWPNIRKNLSCGWEKCTPDVMWYLLLTIKVFPDAISSKFLQKHWGNEDLFSMENLSHWQRLLKQSTTVHPQLHPVCSEFLDLAISKKVLQHIWTPFVDENLFENDQNAYLGFMMVKEALTKSKKKRIVKTVFSSMLCSTLVRSYMNQKSPLHPAATNLVSFLSAFVNECSDHQIQVMVLQVFLQQPRAALLEQVFKKKEITYMISHLTAAAVHAFYEILKKIIFTDDKRPDDNDFEDHTCHIAVHQIGLLVSHQATISNVEWRLDVIKFLFLHAFFIVKEPIIEGLPECNLSISWFPPSLRHAFMNSFTRALDSLNRKVETSLPPLQQLLQFLSSIVEFVDTLLQLPDSSLSPLFPSEKILDSWKNMKSLVQKLSKQGKKDGKINESNAFQILFFQLGLQLFQDHESIPNILEELEVCCKNALKLRKHQNEAASEDNEGPPWIQVVVDILLSLLSQSSHHMRCVVNSVFPLVCPFVTPEALQLILDVINPEKGAEENPLVDEDDDEENEVEFESGSSSDEVDEKMSDNDEVDQEFKSKLKKVLQTADDISDAESEGMLTDSEMFKLNDTLAEVFRSRRTLGHTKLSAEQKTLIDFKIRCLDLIIDYLKTEVPLYIVIQIIKPILSAYESCRNKRQHDCLSQKALSTLKQISKIKKFQNYDKIDETHLEAILGDMINKVQKETDNAMNKILYNLCLFIVLCERKLKALPENESNQAVKLQELTTLKKYLVALDDFVKRHNSHIKPEIFFVLMNACPEHAWQFVEPLENHAFDDSVRLFRKTQCLGLIFSALKFSKGQKNITTEMWLRRSESLVSKAIKALTSVLKGSDVKPLYTTELLSILATIANILKDKNLSVVQNHSELLPLLVSMSTTQCRKLTKNGNYYRKQLIVLLGGDIKKANNSSKKEAPQDEAMDVSENEVQSNGKSKSASSSETGTDSDDGNK